MGNNSTSYNRAFRNILDKIKNIPESQLILILDRASSNYTKSNVQKACDQWLGIFDTYLDRKLKRNLGDYAMFGKLLEALDSDTPTYGDIYNVFTDIDQDNQFIAKSFVLDDLLITHMRNSICVREMELYLEHEPNGSEKIRDFLIEQSERIKKGQEVDHTKEMLNLLDRRDKTKESSFLNDRKESEDEIVARSVRFYMEMAVKPHIKVEANKLENPLERDQLLISYIKENFPEIDYIPTMMILSNAKFALAMEDSENRGIREAFLSGNREVTKNIDNETAQAFFESISNTDQGEDKYFRRFSDQDIVEIRTASEKRFKTIYKVMENDLDMKNEFRRRFIGGRKETEGQTSNGPKGIEELKPLVEIIESQIGRAKSLYSYKDYREMKNEKIDTTPQEGR